MNLFWLIVVAVVIFVVVAALIFLICAEDPDGMGTALIQRSFIVGLLTSILFVLIMIYDNLP
jgi:hypothetical protein